MYKDAVSVDFYGLESECSALDECALQAQELRDELIGVVQMLDGMSFGDAFIKIKEQLYSCISELKNTSEEEQELSLKLRKIKEVYYDVETENINMIDRLPLFSATTAFSGGTNSASVFIDTPQINAVFRGNAVQNEEWLDDLLNDFI